MTTLLTLHPIAEGSTVAACTICHIISRTPAAGRDHIQGTHPRRYALATERQR